MASPAAASADATAFASMPNQTMNGFCSYLCSREASKRLAAAVGLRRRRCVPPVDVEVPVDESASTTTEASPLLRAICANRWAPANPWSVSMSSSETASTPLVDESMCAFSDSCGGMSGPMSLLTVTPRPPPRRLASGETTRLWKADGWARCPPVPWDERSPAVRAAWVSVAGLSPGLLPFIRRRARCDAGNARARARSPPPPRNINQILVRPAADRETGVPQ